MGEVLRPEARTVGYRYYMGMHLAICHGPVDAVLQVLAGDREAWLGEITSTSQVAIDEPQLFGGDQREGGIVGEFDFEFGDASQPPNDYLVDQLGAPQPAYRGILGVVLRQCQLTANNPYLKPLAVKVRRVPAGWNSGEARIGDGANPAHMIRECLLDPAWGMGYPSSAIDDASFAAASSVLVSESFGLSMIWTQQREIREFVQEVLDHIGGVLTVSPSTGRFELKLIRDDYVVSNLPTLDEDSIVELESFQRAGWGETVNEITVIYTRPDNWDDASVTVQDLGNVQIQGPVKETRRYPGITDGDLAARVAMRDLTSISRPLAKLTLRVNREAWDLSPGDAFRFTWPELGIVELVARVVNIDSGTLTDGAIRLQCIEDTFAFRDNAYTEPQPIGWVDPTGPPLDATPRLLLDAAYWTLAQIFSDDELLDLDADAQRTYLQALAGRPDSISLGYQLHTRVNGSGATWGDRTARGGGDLAPHCASLFALRPQLQSTIEYSAGVDVDIVKINRYGYIEAADGKHEAIEVLNVDLVNRALLVNRGILDTVPRAHPAGARIWFAEEFLSTDALEYQGAETIDAKFRTRSTTGELDLDDATTEVHTFLSEARQHRPYPPGNVRVDGNAYPLTFTASLDITWNHRDRLSQTASWPRQTDGNVGPEPGTSYTVRIYGETGSLQNTFSGLTGTSHVYTLAEDIADNGLGRGSTQLTFELEAVRGGVVSWQAHRITVFREESAGWGLQWGLAYGGPTP